MHDPDTVTQISERELTTCSHKDHLNWIMLPVGFLIIRGGWEGRTITLSSAYAHKSHPRWEDTLYSDVQRIAGWLSASTKSKKCLSEHLYSSKQTVLIGLSQLCPEYFTFATWQTTCNPLYHLTESQMHCFTVKLTLLLWPPHCEMKYVEGWSLSQRRAWSICVKDGKKWPSCNCLRFWSWLTGPKSEKIALAKVYSF